MIVGNMYTHKTTKNLPHPILHLKISFKFRIKDMQLIVMLRVGAEKKKILEFDYNMNHV